MYAEEVYPYENVVMYVGSEKVFSGSFMNAPDDLKEELDGADWYEVMVGGSKGFLFIFDECVR